MSRDEATRCRHKYNQHHAPASSRSVPQDSEFPLLQPAMLLRGICNTNLTVVTLVMVLTASNLTFRRLMSTTVDVPHR